MRDRKSERANERVDVETEVNDVSTADEENSTANLSKFVYIAKKLSSLSLNPHDLTVTRHKTLLDDNAILLRAV